MKASEFVQKLKDIVNNYKTLYVMGCFGSPLTHKNVNYYTTNHPYNRQASRVAMIKNATNKTYTVFGFDCVCLIKGVLWGWNGDATKSYGGATYATNGVPDINADTMITKCSNVSTDFSKVEIGEALWTDGHIGVYIGDGLAIEATPIYKNCVQITSVANIGQKTGYNTRRWKKHGKLPWIEYDTTNTPTANTKKSINEVAREVIQGKWGNGEDRKQRLTKAGYDCQKIQAKVNSLLK